MGILDRIHQATSKASSSINFDSMSEKTWYRNKKKLKEELSELEKFYSQYLEIKKYSQRIEEQQKEYYNELQKLSSNGSVQLGEMSNTSNERMMLQKEFENSMSMLENNNSLNREHIQKMEDTFKQKVLNIDNQCKNLQDIYNPYFKFMQDVMDNFQIDKNQVSLSKDEILQLQLPNIKEVPELYKGWVEEINNLEDYSGDTLKDKINSLSDEKASLMGAGGLAGAILLAPVVLAGASAFLLKKSTLMRSNQEKVQINIYNMINTYWYYTYELKDKIDTLEKQKPNRNDFLKEKSHLEKEFNIQYMNKQREIQKQYTDGVNELESDERKAKVEQLKSKLLQELNTKKATYTKEIENMSLSLKNMQNKLNAEIDLYLESQKFPNFQTVEQDNIANKIKECTEQIRKFDDLKMLSGLKYITELPDGELPSERWNRIITYDKSLIRQKEQLQAEIDELLEQGLTRDVFVERRTKLKEQETGLYKVNGDGLILGSRVFSNKLKTMLGDKSTKDELVKALFTDEPIMFLYRDEHERKVLVNFIKYLTLQLVDKYHTESIKVNIINPQATADFRDIQINRDYFDSKYQKVVKGPKYVCSYDTPKQVEEWFNEMDSEDVRLSQSALVNKEKFEQLVIERRETGGVVPKFNINILVDLSLGDRFLKYNLSSRAKGIINWHLVSFKELAKVSLDEKLEYKVEVDLTSVEKATLFNNMVEVISTDTGIADKPTQLQVSYRLRELKQIVSFKPLSSGEILGITDFLHNRAIRCKKDFTLLTEFIEILMGDTDDKLWSGDIEKSVKLFVGFVEGDKTDIRPIVLDEVQQPHMFLAGTTGGGKSIALSVMVNTAKLMYKPSDLDIIYFDFKITEVALHATPYKMPQCSALCGTYSPEYLISLLSYIDNEMMRRYTLFTEWGVNKLSDLRKEQKKKKAQLESMLNEAKSSNDTELISKLEKQLKDFEVTPRMLFIVDELAQGFQTDDDDLKSTIKKVLVRLAQLARAAGIHMVLVSQDVDKVPSEIINLVRIRSCTVAPAEISRNVMKSDFCTLDKNNFVGFLGVNQTGSTTGSEQYVVPLALSDVTPILTKRSIGLLDRFNEKSRDAVVFDENEPFDYNILDKYLEDNINKAIDSHRFALGEGVYFQKNFSPHEIVVRKDDRSSLVVVSTQASEKIRIAKLLYRNLRDTNSLIVPVYCKNYIDEIPYNYFETKYTQKAIENNLVHYMMGKDTMQVNDALKLYEQGLLDQVFPGDLFVPPPAGMECIISDEELKDINNESSLFNYMDMVTDSYKAIQLQGGQTPTMYLFIFDFDKHSILQDSKTSVMNALKNRCNNASSVDIHCIFFTSDVSLFFDRGIGGYYIASKIEGMSDVPKFFRNINAEFCKIEDMRKEFSACVKLPTGGLLGGGE